MDWSNFVRFTLHIMYPYRNFFSIRAHVFPSHKAWTKMADTQITFSIVFLFSFLSCVLSFTGICHENLIHSKTSSFAQVIACRLFGTKPLPTVIHFIDAYIRHQTPMSYLTFLTIRTYRAFHIHISRVFLFISSNRGYNALPPVFSNFYTKDPTMSMYLTFGRSSPRAREHSRDVSLTLFFLDKMAAISQTIISDAFSWMKKFVFCLKFHWPIDNNPALV